jgi:hypothetical protein
MSVPVQRRLGRTMAQLRLHEFDVLSLRDQKRCVGMPQVMEAYSSYPSSVECRQELPLDEIIRVEWTTIHIAENQIQLSGFTNSAVIHESLTQQRRQHDPSDRIRRFRRLKCTSIQRSPYADLRRIPVDIAPLQRHQLATAHSCQYGGHEQWLIARIRSKPYFNHSETST